MEGFHLSPFKQCLKDQVVSVEQNFVSDNYSVSTSVSLRMHMDKTLPL